MFPRSSSTGVHLDPLLTRPPNTDPVGRGSADGPAVQRGRSTFHLITQLIARLYPLRLHKVMAAIIQLVDGGNGQMGKVTLAEVAVTNRPENCGSYQPLSCPAPLILRGAALAR